MHIVEEINDMGWKDYEPQQSYECLNSCVLGYLWNCGYEISPEDIFFIGKGYKLNISLEDIPVIRSELYESSFRFLKFCNIEYVSDHLGEDADAMHFISKCIAEGKMLSIMLSSSMLTHNSVFGQAGEDFHYLNILDESENEYYIADGYVPTSEPTKFIGYVDKRPILDAFKKCGSCYLIGKYNSFCMDMKIIQNESVDSFRIYIKEFLTQNAGRNYIVQILDYIEYLFFIGADNEIKNAVVSVDFHLKTFGFITTKRYTYSKILRLFGDVEATKQYAEVISRWNNNCLLLLRAGFSLSKDKFELVKNSIGRIIEDEVILLKKIANMI